MPPDDIVASPPGPAGGRPGPAGGRERLAALTGRALPAPLRDLPPARLDPGRRGVAALVLVAVAAVALTAYVVWRARPRPVDLAAPPVVTAPSTATGLLVVDVAGDVRRPGLVRVPAGSRVADAIAAAGGLLPGATTDGLNLARRVADGEQVVVGAAPPAPGPGAPGSGPGSGAAAPSGPLDLNTATLEQLDALPGVGPVLAERILEWRNAHGRFATVEQLREVPGIGERKFAQLRDLVTA